MKKGKFFLSLFLSVMLCFGAFSARIPAEEGGDDSWSEETEREYLDAYYEEIQSNNISGWPQGDPVQADAAILMDADTGAVLYAKDIDQVGRGEECLAADGGEHHHRDDQHDDGRPVQKDVTHPFRVLVFNHFIVSSRSMNCFLLCQPAAAAMAAPVA